MKEIKQKINSICAKVYRHGYSQIMIDFVQEDVERILNTEISRDDISSVIYGCIKYLKIFNPELTKDIELLKELQEALTEWETQHVFVNRTLGLPPEM